MSEIMTGYNPAQLQEGSRFGRKLAGVMVAASAVLVGANIAQADGETPQPPTPAEIEAFNGVFGESPVALENVCNDLDAAEASGAVEVFRFENGEGIIVPDSNSFDAVDFNMVPNPEYRISTDALSNGFVTDRSNSQGLLEEFGYKLCESPLETVTHLVALAQARLGENVDASSVNSVLAEFNVPEDQINEIAASLTPVYESDLGRPLTDEEISANISKIRRNEELASEVIAILSRMQMSPIVGDQQVSASYHLNIENGVPTPQFVDGQLVLPEVVYDPNGYGDNPETPNIDESEVLFFEATAKGGEEEGECVIEYGINPHDLRPVGVENGDCETVVPPQPPVVPEVPTPSSSTPEVTPPTTGVTPKEDDNTTPAGVPGQNGGSGTADSGPTGPGVGPSGQEVNEDGTVDGEVLPTAPATTTAPTTIAPVTVPASTGEVPTSTLPPVVIGGTNNTTPVGTTPSGNNI